jgi:hypothetical protein
LADFSVTAARRLFARLQSGTGFPGRRVADAVATGDGRGRSQVEGESRAWVSRDSVWGLIETGVMS